MNRTALAVDPLGWPAPLEVAARAQQLTTEIADLEFRSTYFVTIRKDLHAHLQTSQLAQRLNQLVTTLLDPDASDPPSPQ